MFQNKSKIKMPRRCSFIKCKHIICSLLVILLLWLHFKLIPSVTSQYDTDCYLAPESKKNLEFLLKTIITSFEKHGVYYWLDFGSLLGAVRYHGIVPWDGDGDISFLRNDPKIHMALSEIKETEGMSANTMVAQYKGMSVDFMRWEKDVDYYKKYYPPWVQDNVVTKLNSRLESFPLKLVGKRKKLKFIGMEVAVPEQYESLLKRRYKLTHWFSVPFKWKCYVPCFLKTDQSCNQ